jgi:hypothetical protein
MIVNLVLYSGGEPFNTTKQLIIQSISKFTTKQIIIHNYTLETIKKFDWFEQIKDLPSVYKEGRRDGYYCAYKAFCCREACKNMNEGDILYYVDCSQHFRTGFTQSIDKLCDIAYEKEFIAGSVGDDVTNGSWTCCHNLDVWNKIIPNRDNSKYLNYRHILASWFIMKKNNTTTDFLNEFANMCAYKDDKLIHPLVTYHHTGDQSIFNILVSKYNFFVFYKKGVGHSDNKDRNLVLSVINNAEDDYKYFINLYDE